MVFKLVSVSMLVVKVFNRFDMRPSSLGSFFLIFAGMDSGLSLILI